MSTFACRKIPLSSPRRLICDLMHFSQQIPTVTIGRQMNLAEVVAARQAARPRPSWCAIFTKAYAAVAARHPEMRRSYLSFPWPHLCEHAVNVAAIAVERRLGNEDAVLLAPLRAPENQALLALDQHLRRYKEQPVESIGSFCQTLRINRLPRPLRRLLWWYALNVSGRQRARCFGTFAVTSIAGLGADSLRPLSLWTTLLHYGVFDQAGGIYVRLTFDHRVMDGAILARALEQMEQVLRKAIVTELHSLDTELSRWNHWRPQAHPPANETAQTR